MPIKSEVVRLNILNLLDSKLTSMTDSEIENQQSPISIKTGLLYWLVCLLILIILIKIPVNISSNSSILIVVVYYLAAGIFLNRKVLKNIIGWHPIYNTLENVSTIKLRHLIFWPVAYALLFLRLGINKLL